LLISIPHFITQLPVASLCTASQYTMAAKSQGTLYIATGSRTQCELSTCNIFCITARIQTCVRLV